MLVLQQTARVEELRAAKYQNILESNPVVSLLKGFARFKNENTLLVTKADGTEQSLVPDKTPEQLIVIGSLVIALEITQAYQRLVQM